MPGWAGRIGPVPMTEDLGIIRLVGLRAYGYHGLLAGEREVGQEFVIDVMIAAPWPEDDLLEHTIDYAAVADEVVSLVEREPVNLIETLAARIADRLIVRLARGRVRVTVHKPQAPIRVPFADVSATCERSIP